METVSIETTQNVRLDYEAASIGDRIVATLIDWAIFIVYIILFSFIGSSTGLFESTTAIVLIYLPLILYDLLCELFMSGRSVGKLVMNIRVVKIDGTQPGLGNYLLRWVFRLVESVPFMFGAVGLITIIANGKGQRLGDIAAKTAVIKPRRKVQLSDTILSSTNPDYIPIFPQVAQLNDRDVGIIKDVMQEAQRHGNWRAIEALAAQTKKTMGVTSTMPDMQFLQTVLYDYSNYDFK